LIPLVSSQSLLIGKKIRDPKILNRIFPTPFGNRIIKNIQAVLSMLEKFTIFV